MLLLIDRSTTSRTSRTSSHVRTRTTKKIGGGDGGTFTFPIRVTCAEDDEDEDDQQQRDGETDREGGASSRPRAETYAVELSIIDDSVHNLQNAADHRDHANRRLLPAAAYHCRQSHNRKHLNQQQHEVTEVVQIRYYIKDQGAKIEKLERLVKQMLEPEETKHEQQ